MINLKTAANCHLCVVYNGNVLANVSHCDTETGEMIIDGKRVSLDPAKLTSRRVRREDKPVSYAVALNDNDV